jgi:hypothetical protein
MVDREKYMDRREFIAAAGTAAALASASRAFAQMAAEEPMMHPPVDGQPFGIGGVRMPSWIIKFDKDGACISPHTRQALLVKVAKENGPTDIIFMSHGWNSDFADAISQYKAFLGNFEQLTLERRPAREYRPLFAGVSWPSVWFPIDNGPSIGGPSIGGPEQEALARTNVVAAVTANADSANRLNELLAKDRLTEAEAQEAFDIALRSRNSGSEIELPMIGSPPSAADMLDALKKIQSLEIGGGAAPGVLAYLDPRNLARIFSVWTMKDRAGLVGAGGVASLLRDFLSLKEVKMHLVGHSFGAKVMLSALCSMPVPQRPASSALLLQPALSYLAFASALPGVGSPGGYRTALDSNRVEKPIFSTFSRLDFPLRDLFHLALRRAGDEGELGGDPSAPPSIYAALGGYGPRGANEMLIDPIRKPGDAYPPVANRIIGLDGSGATDYPVASGIARIACHGCVANPYTAWALYQQMFAP